MATHLWSLVLFDCVCDMDHEYAVKWTLFSYIHRLAWMCSNVFTMFAAFCGHADKNHIYTVLTVTTGPLRANIMLIWSSVKMSLTTCYSRGVFAYILLFFSVFFTWKFSVFCIFPFACSHRFDFSNRYEHTKVQLLLIKFNTRTPGKNIPWAPAMSISKPSEF